MTELFNRWYKQHKDDQGLMIAVGLSPGEERSVPKDKALAWFESRYKRVSRKFSLENDELVIYRCMSVDKDWIKKFKNGEIESVGDHWTLDKELVPFLAGGFGGTRDKKNNIILEAVVHIADFDILSLFQPSYADEYEEFEVLPKRVVLIKIHSGDFSKVIANDCNLPLVCRN